MLKMIERMESTPKGVESRIFIMAGLAIVTLLCAAAYFRVFATEAGYMSVGRVWYYFRNYWDIGFAPTTLVGTIIEPFISFPVEEPYKFAWGFLGIFLIVFSGLFLTLLWRHVLEKSFVWAAVLMMSPALLPHAFYNLGNLDVFIMIIAITATLFFFSLPTLLVLSFIGVATHSLFLFSFFPLFVVLYYDKHGFSSPTFILTSGLLVITAIFFLVMGTGVTPAEYKQLMAQHAPGLDRDGSLEMFYSLSESIKVTWRERQEFGFPFFWFFAVSMYVGGLIYFALDQRMPLMKKILLVTAFVTPSLLTFLVTDIYRWLSMSAFNVFLYILYLAKNSKEEDNLLAATNGAKHPNLFLATMLPWILLGPVGTTCFGKCGATAFPFLKRLLDSM